MVKKIINEDLAEKEIIKYMTSCVIKRLDEISNSIGLFLEDDVLLLDYSTDGKDIIDKLKTISDMSLSMNQFVEDELVDKYMWGSDTLKEYCSIYIKTPTFICRSFILYPIDFLKYVWYNTDVN